MAIGISPTVDFAFKLMLGSPEHSRVTIHFPNAILVDQPRITHVKILNPFLGKELEDDKLSILDVLATDGHGRMLNIEMQTSLPSELSQRLAYSLRNAEQLTQSEISQLFPDQEIAEAAGVLEMISQTPEQRLLYDARLKFQRDEESILRQARQEGFLLGRIATSQDLLGMQPSTTDELAGYDETQLNEMAEQLQRQLRSRGE